MTINEMFLKGGKSKDWYYRNLPEISEQNKSMVIRGEKHDENANKKITTYQYNPGQNPNSIPTWNEILIILDDIINNKTKKTKKTELENKIEQWFSDNVRKPRKPKSNQKSDENRGVFVGFLNQKEHLQQRGFLKFLVFAFLHERDEKRYKKYYADKIDLAVTENRDDKKQSKLPLIDKILDVKQYVEQVKGSGNDVSYIALTDHFDETLISNLIESGQLIKHPNGNFEWSI